MVEQSFGYAEKKRQLTEVHDRIFFDEGELSIKPTRGRTVTTRGQTPLSLESFHSKAL
jgi:hypothetical protein